MYPSNTKILMAILTILSAAFMYSKTNSSLTTNKTLDSLCQCHCDSTTSPLTLDAFCN